MSNKDEILINEAAANQLINESLSARLKSIEKDLGHSLTPRIKVITEKKSVDYGTDINSNCEVAIIARKTYVENRVLVKVRLQLDKIDDQSGFAGFNYDAEIINYQLSDQYINDKGWTGCYQKVPKLCW